MTDLTCKTVAGKQFTVDVDVDVDTLGSIKDKIAAQEGLVRDNMKMVYLGKLLTKEEEKLSDIEYEEGNFIVVIPGRKRKTKKKKKPVEEKKEEIKATPTEKVEEKKNDEENKMKDDEPQQETTTTTTEETTGSNNNNEQQEEEIPEELKESLEQLLGMGFERKQSIKCLLCAEGNLNNATEFLLSGIPPHAERLYQQRRMRQQQQQQPQSNNPLRNLMAQQPPQQQQQQQQRIQAFQGSEFENMRQLMRNNPEFLQQFLEGLAQERPDLIEEIRNNQEAFTQLLAGSGPVPQQFMQQQQQQQQIPRGQQRIEITPEERVDIDQLMALGFDGVNAAQAYFAFEKNVELASNFLFQELERGNIDLVPQQPQQQQQQPQNNNDGNNNNNNNNNNNDNNNNQGDNNSDGNNQG